MVHTGSYVTSAKPVTLGQSAADALTEVTNRAALALLEDIEARRLANEELAATATDVIDQAVYGNRAEAYHTALRIVARALPAIMAEAQRPSRTGPRPSCATPTTTAEMQFLGWFPPDARVEG